MPRPRTSRCRSRDLIHPPELITLLPGLHLLETEVEDFDVRAAVIVGATEAVVFDTLAHPLQMEGVAALVGGRQLTVVYSHADWDHAWGTCALDPARVVAQEAAAARFLDDVPAELGERRSRDPATWDAVTLVPPTVTFDARLDMELGGVTLELHALPGHTPDCRVGFLPEWGVLLAGDTVETPLPVVNDGGAVPGWMDRLADWLRHPGVTQVVPSHGRIGGKELVEETLAYLDGVSRGRAGPDPGALPPFYRETHLRNVALIREASTGGS